MLHRSPRFLEITQHGRVYKRRGCIRGDAACAFAEGITAGCDSVSCGYDGVAEFRGEGYGFETGDGE